MGIVQNTTVTVVERNPSTSLLALGAVDNPSEGQIAMIQGDSSHDPEVWIYSSISSHGARWWNITLGGWI